MCRVHKMREGLKNVTNFGQSRLDMPQRSQNEFLILLLYNGVGGVYTKFALLSAMQPNSRLETQNSNPYRKSA